MNPPVALMAAGGPGYLVGPVGGGGYRGAVVVSVVANTPSGARPQKPPCHPFPVHVVAAVRVAVVVAGARVAAAVRGGAKEPVRVTSDLISTRRSRCDSLRA